MAKLKVKKGLEANLPAVEDGSLLITTDSKKLYLDSGEERIQVGGDSGSAGTYLFHLKFTDSTESAVINIDGDFSKLSAAATNGLCVIARVHDYEDMIYFNDYYISSGTGSSTAPASPYQFNYYDGLKLNCITINDFTDTGLSYSVSSTGVRTILFTKTSSTEYTCGTDVALIVEENAVVGKVPNEGNNGYTFFYKVRDSIDNTSATPSDTVATTFISCDGNTIKKLTTQYSDYGVWHYSEQSLSGGGADASIYSPTGIKTPSALTDGFPVMNNDASVTYARFNQGKTTLTSVTGTVDGDPGQRATITAQPTSSVARSVLDLAVRNTTTTSEDPNGLSLRSYSSVFEACPLSSSTTTAINRLGSANSHWDEILVDKISGVGATVADGKSKQLVFSSDAGISNPTSTNYAFTSFKFNTQCAGGPQGTGTYNNALIYGFDTPVTTCLYTEYPAGLGKATYPWRELWLYGAHSSYGKIERLGSSGATASDTFIIRQSNNTIESSVTTANSTSESSIVLQAATTCRNSGADTTATGSLTIQTTAQGLSPTATMSVYPTLGFDGTSPSFTSLGTPSAPWDTVFTKNLSLNGSFVSDFVVGASPKSYRALTSTQMNGLPGSGKYLKRSWANGMQEVWIELELGNITEWTAWGQLYEHVFNKAALWPVTWSGVPQVTMSASCTSDAIFITPTNPTKSNTGVISIKSAGAVTRSDVKIHIYAVGLAG